MRQNKEREKERLLVHKTHVDEVRTRRRTTPIAAKERPVLRNEFIVVPEREVHEQSVWFLRMRLRGKVFVQSNRKRGRRSRHVRSV